MKEFHVPNVTLEWHQQGTQRSSMNGISVTNELKINTERLMESEEMSWQLQSTVSLITSPMEAFQDDRLVPAAQRRNLKYSRRQSLISRSENPFRRFLKGWKKSLIRRIFSSNKSTKFLLLQVTYSSRQIQLISQKTFSSR